MTELATELTRPRGRYGVDGDYRLIPAPVILGGYLLLCLATAVFAGKLLVSGRTLFGLGVAVVAFLLISVVVSIRRFSRRGKFEVWARLLTRIGLRGDERVLDLGCGRGAVLLTAAKLVPRGSAVGVDIWRADQTGNSPEATLANADAEGVADRVELHTADMTDLAFPDGSSTSVSIVFSSSWLACGSDPHGCGQSGQATPSTAYVGSQWSVGDAGSSD